MKNDKYLDIQVFDGDDGIKYIRYDDVIKMLEQIKQNEELESKRLNNIITNFDIYLERVLYTYRKNDLSEACIQLRLAKNKLQELKGSDKE